MRKHLEYSGGGSHKFWRIETSGKTLTVTFGRIGSAGQRKTKSLATAPLARAEAEKQIAAKLKKGYVEETAAGAPKRPKKAKKAEPARGPAKPVGRLDLAAVLDPERETERLLRKRKKDAAKIYRRYATNYPGYQELVRLAWMLAALERYEEVWPLLEQAEQARGMDELYGDTLDELAADALALRARLHAALGDGAAATRARMRLRETLAACHQSKPARALSAAEKAVVRAQSAPLDHALYDLRNVLSELCRAVESGLVEDSARRARCETTLQRGLALIAERLGKKPAVAAAPKKTARRKSAAQGKYRLAGPALAAAAKDEPNALIAEQLARLSQQVTHWGAGNRYAAHGLASVAWSLVALGRDGDALAAIDSVLDRLKPKKTGQTSLATELLAARLRLMRRRGDGGVKQVEKTFKETDYYHDVTMPGVGRGAKMWNQIIGDAFRDKEWKEHERGPVIKALRELTTTLGWAAQIVEARRAPSWTARVEGLLEGELLPLLKKRLTSASELEAARRRLKDRVGLDAVDPRSADWPAALDARGEKNRIVARAKARAAKKPSLKSERSLQAQLEVGACLLALGRDKEALDVLEPASRLAFAGDYGLWYTAARIMALRARLLRRAGDAKAADRLGEVIRIWQPEVWPQDDLVEKCDGLPRAFREAREDRSSSYALCVFATGLGFIAYLRETGRVRGRVADRRLDGLFDEGLALLAERLGSPG